MTGNQHSDKDEQVVKEYPNSTNWILDGEVVGVGNLILTDRRFAFLHRVNPTEQQIESINQFIEKGSTEKLLDYSLRLDKRNFQIELSPTILAKVGLYSIFPFPHPCLRIFHRDH